MEQTLLPPDRKGSYLSLAFGIVCAAIGAPMVVPGLGLRIDAQGST